MTMDQVVTLLWAYATSPLTPTEYSLVLAALSCNLHGTAPTPAALAALNVMPRSMRNARASLLEQGLLVEGQGGKLAVPPLKSLFLQANGMPNDGKGLPNSGDFLPESGENSPQKSHVSQSPSRAVVAVDLKDFETSSSALTADLKQSVKHSSARAAELKDFARHVCKLPDDDEVFSILEKHGDALTCQALEQYQHNYTRRARQAQRPTGQLLAWCKNPALMDPLPPHAITVAAWLAKRTAVAEAKPTSAGLPSRGLDPSTVKRRAEKAAADKAKAESWAAKCEPLADKFSARPLVEQDAALLAWRKSRMFTNQLDCIIVGVWLENGRQGWRGIDVFSGAVRDGLAIAESYLTGTPGKF